MRPCGLHKKVVSYFQRDEAPPLEQSEPLITADGFYEKNVGSVSFFYARCRQRGDFFMPVSFAGAARAGLAAAALLKKRER